MISTSGKVYEQRGKVYVLTSRPAEDNLADDVTVLWHDSRMISDEQRRKAYALVGEITAWAGYMSKEKETVNQHLKQRFLMAQVEEYQRQMFSLADCTMTRAREYINYLIDFCLSEDVPTRMPLIELADDVKRMIYSCLCAKKCCVCQKKADVHHCEGSTVGMGRNRDEMINKGLELMPLCCEHHQECHIIGQRAFNEKYHVVGVIADENICKKVGLKYAS